MIEQVLGVPVKLRQSVPVIAVALSLVLGAAPARSATFTVDSVLDTGADYSMTTLAGDEADGNGLSLREAVYWANNNGMDDTIVIDA